MPEPPASLEQRVLLLAPTARDAAASRQLLAGVGLNCLVCASVEALCDEIERGAGAAILPEEVVMRDGGARLAALLHDQPPWSDLPVIVLTGAGRTSDDRVRELLQLGDITFSRRPLEVASFLNLVRAALRDRGRQYQVRDYLVEQQRQAALLREADRRKDEFLAMLAHELRNPLAPVRNGLQILRLAEHDAPLVAQTRDMIDRQVQHLTRLVDDLLDVSRITRGKVELRREPVNLAEACAGAVETARPHIDARQHRLMVTQPGRPVWVNADLTRLTQVVSNLLTNAAKYSEPGGQIALTVEVVGALAIIRVRDTGIGIPPEMLPKVFDLFTQLDRTLDRSQGGLGIGLTLVRSLVELHGGSVAASSEGVGQGSEFVVSLPLLSGDAAQAPGGGDTSTDRARRRARVLVVDDNVDAADSLAVLLRLLGHEVQTAYHGLKVLEAARTLLPDAVLLDIGLPGIDGYEVARRLRGEPCGAAVLLIALTGYGQEEDRRRTREAGFDHHLTKPVEPHVLQELLVERR